MKKINKYKICVSIIFGISGLIANYFSFEIIKLSKINLNVNFLWGLIFPLLITLAWGWRYGLISALSGGCFTLWWLRNFNGYGFIFSGIIFTLWIIWHGFWNIKYLKQKKWFLNKYILEIIFRLLIIPGYFFIYKYLILINPPSWFLQINSNYINNNWLNMIMTKHLILGFILLLISDILSS